MITDDGLRAMLVKSPDSGVPPTIGLDEEFVLDSLGLTWLMHEVSERHGLDPDLEEPRLSQVTTISRMAGYLRGLDEGAGRDG